MLILRWRATHLTLQKIRNKQLFVVTDVQKRTIEQHDKFIYVSNNVNIGTEYDTQLCIRIHKSCNYFSSRELLFL